MLPAEIELFIDDVPVKVRYDYDRGEDQWFDARAGVGSPGYPASATITELSFDGIKWLTPDDFPQANFEALDNELMEKLAELEAEENAAAAQSEYEAWQDAKRYEGWDTK